MAFKCEMVYRIRYRKNGRVYKKDFKKNDILNAIKFKNSKIAELGASNVVMKTISLPHEPYEMA